MAERRKHDTLESPETDVVKGLSSPAKSLPTRYLYDEKGSALFDRICDLPEYYPTRTEHALLAAAAGDIVALTGADALFELGSGTARKTRVLISAFLEKNRAFSYVPFDISDAMLEQCAADLKKEFPSLIVEPVVGDFTMTLAGIPQDKHMLAAFLGSTIGNFSDGEALALLTELGSRLAAGSWFLLGVDLVKPAHVLEAAYNDSEGITAAFNKNILNVINNECGGNFDESVFEHKAHFNEEKSRIEMHLVAKEPTQICLDDLDLTVDVEKGEHVLTEISRKFSKPDVEHLLAAAGFSLEQWFTSGDGYFALALARVRHG